MTTIEKISIFLGGASAILTVIVTFIGNNIINRLKISWERNSQKQLSILKGEIDKNNSSVSQLLNNHSKSLYLLSEKKISCIDEFWGYIIALKELNYGTEYLYSFLTDTELSALLTSSSSPSINFRDNDLRKIANDYPEISKKIGEYKYKVDKIRPFIGEKLYGLYFIYTLFCMRSTFLLIGGIDKTKSNIWKDDKSLIQVLKDVISEKQMNEIIESKFGSYNSIVNLLESKIIIAINYSITGEEVIDNTYQQIGKIEAIIAKQKSR